MNYVAHEVTERLFGGDKIKFRLIRHWITYTKKTFDAFVVIAKNLLKVYPKDVWTNI